MNKIANLLLALSISASSCAQEQDRTIPKKENNGSKAQLIEPGAPNRKAKGYKLEDFYSNNTQLSKEVDALFNKMSLDERAAQMIMPAIGMKGFGLSVADALKLYTAKQAAGFLFLKGTPEYFKDANNQMKLASASQLTAPIISCDGEAALIHYKFIGTPKQTPASQQLTYQNVLASSAALVNRIQPMGIQINFAPVVDNNVNKAIIGNRSFGANAQEIGYKAVAFIQSHQAKQEVAVAKHFPGHGAVSGDSHKGLVSIKGDLTEIGTFAEVFKSKPIGVMIGHIAVQNNERWGTNGEPATLSRKISTDLLKDSLGYNGIVFTDALNMGAVSKLPDASFRAAKAGADVLLMPINVPALHKKIKTELQSNGAYAKQFNESIKKILRLKLCLGLV